MADRLEQLVSQLGQGDVSRLLNLMDRRGLQIWDVKSDINYLEKLYSVKVYRRWISVNKISYAIDIYWLRFNLTGRLVDMNKLKTYRLPEPMIGKELEFLEAAIEIEAIRVIHSHFEIFGKFKIPESGYEIYKLLESHDQLKRLDELGVVIESPNRS